MISSETIRNNLLLYPLVIIISMIMIHQIPMYLLFEFFGVQSDIANLLDKIILNIVIIVLAYKEIILNGLLPHAGLKINKIESPWVYPYLLIYLAIFTGGFVSFLKIESSDLYSFLVLLFLMKYITVGIFEEIVFRSLLQSKFIVQLIDKKNGIVKAICLAAFFFGFSHIVNVGSDYMSLTGVVSQIFAAFCIGSLYGVALFKTKNIYPIISIHAAIDFFSLIGVLFPEYFPAQVQEEKTTAEIISSLVLTVMIFGSSFIIAMFLISDDNKQNNARINSINKSN